MEIQSEEDAPATIGSKTKATERKGGDILNGGNQQTTDAKAQRGTTDQLQKQPSTDDSSSCSTSSSSSSSLFVAYVWTYGPYGVAGTLVYRAIWELQSECMEYAFPGQPVVSCLASIVVALVCSVLLLTFPRTLRRNESLATVLMIVVTVFYLRGVWDFWDLVVFPEHPMWQTLAGFIPGFLVLWSMGALRWGLVGAPVILVDDSKAKDKSNLPLIQLFHPPWSKEWSDRDDADELKID